MSEVKKEKKFNKKLLLIPIIAGGVALITLVSFLIWHFVTLPDANKALKNSPFAIEGEWFNPYYNFHIVSEKEEKKNVVTGTMSHDYNDYSFTFSYKENKGLDREYDVTIYITAHNGSKYSCLYEFSEEEFILKDFNKVSGEKIQLFEELKSIKFTEFI